jgi:phosphoglycolate phosphatase-like HAD superfamily hydrolase
LSTLLFDFDGTLADSLAAIVAISNRLAPEFGYRPTPFEEVETLKGLTARQLIRHSGIPVLTIPAFLRRLQGELRCESAHIPPCAGMPAVIQALHNQGHRLGVITSNTPEVVRSFLVAHNLESCFFTIAGGSTLFKKGKLIAQCLRQHQLPPGQTVYVGDEVRDVEAARAAGVRSVAVVWGFNNRDRLAAAQPDWLIEVPEVLCAIADAI